MTVCVVLPPTKTLPKLRLDGLDVSEPCTPVPLKEIIAGDPGALLLMTMFPVTLPVEAGANWMVKEALDPGLMASGTLRPARRNPVPAAVAWEMVKAAFPEFVKEIFWLAVPVTFTFPKLTLDGAIVSFG
jgi:hypothetical protein